MVHNGVARTMEGSLAGSTLTMDTAVRNVVEAADTPLPQALQMTTYNPARAIGVDDRKGSLAPGKDADILVLHDSPTVVLTMVKGQVVYQAKEREAL